jgi:DNA-directed RNA polymerase I subunit RPA49
MFLRFHEIVLQKTYNRYLPGLYDPETNTLTLTPAPLYLMSHRAKRLKMAPLSSTATPDASAEWRIKRNDLGEAFGTRKAKSQIKAQERGKVNAAAMEGVKDHLMESIVTSDETEGESSPTIAMRCTDD